ncbi:hypothetical protein OAQ08_03275 [Alphaproteobacteria bacterium]|nr:hypothetical protein [Alphaproteobacteria bacterium]
MKNYLIDLYGSIVMVLVFVGILFGTYLSYNFASTSYNFVSTFLLGIAMTICTVALLSGLLLIQLENNELLRDIKKNTDKSKININDEENKKLKEKIYQENKAKHAEELRAKKLKSEGKSLDPDI